MSPVATASGSTGVGGGTLCEDNIFSAAANASGDTLQFFRSPVGVLYMVGLIQGCANNQGIPVSTIKWSAERSCRGAAGTLLKI